MSLILSLLVAMLLCLLMGLLLPFLYNLAVINSSFALFDIADSCFAPLATEENYSFACAAVEEYYFSLF